MKEKGFKVLAFACKDLNRDDYGLLHDNKTHDEDLYDVELDGFTLIGLIGLQDTVNPEMSNLFH